MNKKTTIDLNNLTPQQQQNLDNLFAEIKYLTPEQSSAISDPEKMTQEIFNIIELRRMEIGPELEDLTIELFFRYPEFAINYTDRLERALFCQDITVEELEPYESMRQAILKEFDYDIGDIEE